MTLLSGLFTKEGEQTSDGVAEFLLPPRVWSTSEAIESFEKLDVA
jgi:hypothetical protein